MPYAAWELSKILFQITFSMKQLRVITKINSKLYHIFHKRPLLALFESFIRFHLDCENITYDHCNSVVAIMGATVGTFTEKL